MLITVIYKVSGTFNETLTLSSLAYVSSENSLFLFLDKSQVQKSVDVITCSFYPVKTKNSEASIVGTLLLPLSSVIFL